MIKVSTLGRRRHSSTGGFKVSKEATGGLSAVYPRGRVPPESIAVRGRDVGAELNITALSLSTPPIRSTWLIGAMQRGSRTRQ